MYVLCINLVHMSLILRNRGCFFLVNFVMMYVPRTATITRGKSQIWLQVREDSRHFGESCYVLATSNNSNNQVSKYGDIHAFLLRM